MQESIYSLNEIKEIINSHKNYLSEKYFVDSFMLFGSYAKNLQTKDSDIDLIVNFTKPVDMFDFIELEEYLSKIFNKKIDLGTLKGLKHFIKDDILKEAKRRKDELNKIISNYDRAVSNWLHEVELEKKKDACGGYLKYKDIKEIVDKRRLAKDEWTIINNILRMDFRCLDREVVNNAVVGLTKRKFTYRVVEEEETENVM